MSPGTPNTLRQYRASHTRSIARYPQHDTSIPDYAYHTHSQVPPHMPRHVRALRSRRHGTLFPNHASHRKVEEFTWRGTSQSQVGPATKQIGCQPKRDPVHVPRWHSPMRPPNPACDS
eukprot:1209424-Rhodomonas_salina.2